MLTTTGYYDADQSGALYYYKNLKKYNPKARQHLVIGPYNHGSAQWMPQAMYNGKELEDNAQIALYKYVIKWFDWALKGKALPSFYKDNVNYFNVGKNEWKAAPSLEAIVKNNKRFYLDLKATGSKYDARSLSESIPAGDGQLTYRHDIHSTMDSMLLFASGEIKGADDSVHAFNRSLFFETAPFAQDMMLGGFLSARLYASLNVPDADIYIYYEEVDAKGKAHDLGYDFMRTRYRNSNEKPELMQPGKIVPLNFTHPFLNIKKIAKGMRLRISINVDNSPFNEKNYGFGGEVSKETTNAERIIEVKVYTGKKYPSYIVVPVQ